MSKSDGVWVLVFDTETTGVGPDYRKQLGYDGANKVSSKLANGEGWPENIAVWDESKTYIAQISYIMYNLTTNEYKIINKFISDIPEKVVDELLANEETTHPIILATLKKARDASAFEKATILEAMTIFIADCQKAQVVIAHNAEFDRRLVFCEAARLIGLNVELFDIFLANQHKMYCTMCVAKDIVRIDSKIFKEGDISRRIPYMERKKIYPNGPKGRYEFTEVAAFKSPALWEVYDRMFGYPPDDSALHDALVDVVVCLRVFYRLWMTGNTSSNGPINILVCGYGEPDIYEKDQDTGGRISEYIRAITPPGIDPGGNFDPSLGLGICFIEGQLYGRIPGKKVLTWQQRIQMEENREKALKRKRDIEAVAEEKKVTSAERKRMTSTERKKTSTERKKTSSEGKKVTSAERKRVTMSEEKAGGKRRSKKIKITTGKKIRKRNCTRKVKVKYTHK
uniref:Exonuclease domain-containing protein n=1 Tax=viral metagenome TaxID=1070528 RepID=A0A6C0BA98_9ZZZZ